MRETKPPDLEFEGAGDPVCETGRVLLGLCEGNNIGLINSIQWRINPSVLLDKFVETAPNVELKDGLAAA